jgi:hypothetical protein
MRRQELIQAIEKVVHAFQNSGIASLVLDADQEVGERGQDGRPERGRKDSHPTTSDLLDMYARYSAAFANFGEIEKQLIEKFRLTEFSNPRLWEHIIKTESGMPSVIANPLRSALETRPNIKPFLERETGHARGCIAFR